MTITEYRASRAQAAEQRRAGSSAPALPAVPSAAADLSLAVSADAGPEAAAGGSW